MGGLFTELVPHRTQPVQKCWKVVTSEALCVEAMRPSVVFDQIVSKLMLRMRYEHSQDKLSQQGAHKNMIGCLVSIFDSTTSTNFFSSEIGCIRHTQTVLYERWRREDHIAAKHPQGKNATQIHSKLAPRRRASSRTDSPRESNLREKSNLH